ISITLPHATSSLPQHESHDLYQHPSPPFLQFSTLVKVLYLLGNNHPSTNFSLPIFQSVSTTPQIIHLRFNKLQLPGAGSQRCLSRHCLNNRLCKFND
ncbi:hypothetical protein SK128_015321, partial [Halocaridina rubra]